MKENELMNVLSRISKLLAKWRKERESERERERERGGKTSFQFSEKMWGTSDTKSVQKNFTAFWQGNYSPQLFFIQVFGTPAGANDAITHFRISSCYWVVSLAFTPFLLKLDKNRNAIIKKTDSAANILFHTLSLSLSLSFWTSGVSPLEECK